MEDFDDEEIDAVAKVKKMADERVYRYVERGAFLAKVVYGAVAGIVALTLYMGHLQWTVGQHSVYISELKNANVRARVAELERAKLEDGHRRDNQINQLFEKEFGFKPNP